MLGRLLSSRNEKRQKRQTGQQLRQKRQKEGMTNPTIAVLAEQQVYLELPDGQFVRIDTRDDFDQQYRVELLDSTGKFIRGFKSGDG